jgi:hypothetical protein
MRDGPTISSSSQLAVPRGFGGSLMERSFGEGTWSTRAIIGDSLCSSPTASVVFIFVVFIFLVFGMLSPFAAC